MKNMRKNKEKHIAKALGSVLLCLCLIAGNIGSVWGAPAEEENAEEQENQQMVEIHISSYADLQKLAENCRLDSWSQDKAVYLDNDISCSGEEFSMIPSFGGIFYGQGHSITNLSLTEAGSNVGLFRFIQESGRVEQLKVSGTLKPEGSKTYVGGIAGSNSGVIEDCFFQGSVNGQDYVGGIAGVNRVTGIIRNSSASGVIYGSHGAGGIVGENQGLVQGCENENHVNAVISEETVDLSDITIADITATEHAADITDAGGIAGVSSGVIQSCVNRGVIGYQHIGYNIGGIAGRQSGYIGMCTNQGIVYGRKEVGGIVGQMEPNMVLEYNQTTLEQISPRLQELQSSIDKALTDMNGMSSAVGKELQTMSPYVKSASESAEAMLNAYKEEKEPEINIPPENPVPEEPENPEPSTENSTELPDADTILDHIDDEIDRIDTDTKGDQIRDEIENEDINSVIEDIRDNTENIDSDKIQDELEHIKPSEDNAAFQAAKTNFSDSMRNIADSLSRLGVLLADNGSVLNQDIQEISNQAFGILNTLAYGMEQEDSELIEDVSDEDNQEAIEGKVGDCINSGMIEGDLNVGGIAGAMAIEHDLDPEDDIQVEGEISANVQYKTRVVIRGCENQGNVEGKKDCAGGIVGNMTMGSVMNSVTTGMISSSGGDYVGGIAGWSEGIIRNCSAKCWLSGENYIGGIAGQGKEIYASHTMVRIQEGTECLGAIAGAVEEDGIAEDNLFVGNNVAGIDGISYQGKAEPVTQEELTAMEQVSDIFRTCTVSFIADETVISQVTVDYGGKVNPEDVPDVPEQEGCYGIWEAWDSTHITFDERIEASYVNYVTALETEEKRNGSMALAVVEGAFTEEDILGLEEYKKDYDAPNKNKVIAEVWALTIPEDGSNTHVVRYLPPEEETGIDIYVLDDGGWSKVETEEDGKYLTFMAEKEEVVFLVMARRKPFWYSWFHS